MSVARPVQLFASAEQTLLGDSLARWLAEHHGFQTRRRRLHAGGVAFDRDDWRRFGELGWLAAGLPAGAGGLGGGAADHLAVGERLGAALWSGPWLESIVIGADLLCRCDSPLARSVCEALAGGGAVLACALFEAQPAMPAIRAVRAGHGWRLDGDAHLVAWAAEADWLLLAARIDDDTPGLFLLPADAAGLGREDGVTLDGRPVSQLALRALSADADALLAEGEAAAALGVAGCDRGSAALVAETCGAMWALLEATLVHLRGRQQFGVTLGSLQALQHRMVDLYADCEMVRSMSWLAAHAADAVDAGERARGVSAARARSGRAATRLAQEVVQLHGGMGMSDDMPVGHYFKRITAINTTLGDPDWHMRRYAALRRPRG